MSFHELARFFYTFSHLIKGKRELRTGRNINTTRNLETEQQKDLSIPTRKQLQVNHRMRIIVTNKARGLCTHTEAQEDHKLF